MSETKVPNIVRNQADDQYVIDALKVIEDNQLTHERHRDEIEKIKDLIDEAYVVSQPTGLTRVGSSLILQASDNIVRKMQIPSANYWVQADNPSLSNHLGKILRDGVETVMEWGGFEAVMTEKPSGFRMAAELGDAIIRIGTDMSSAKPIKFDLAMPDQVYVDSNATVFNSVTGARRVTRCVVVYSYDYDQAVGMYPDVKFGLGDIPNQLAIWKDFNKTWEQEQQSDLRKVQIAHYFDIGGDKPCHVVFAGTACTILEKNAGNAFPFIDSKTQQAYIPLDQFKFIDSREGFWNYGLGHLFYRYDTCKRQLFNKAISQSMNSMNDTQVISVARNKGGEILQRIKDARDMGKVGQMGIIINDTGEPITVNKLQADQYEQSLKALNEWFDQEVRRFGINIDAIREQKSTTATQILAESEVEDEFVASIIERNTEFFKRMHYRTMDFIREYVDDNDETPIWTSLKMPAIRNEQVVMNGEQPVPETVVVTLGDIKQLLVKYEDAIYVEIDTKTGVKEKDSIKTAKALLAMRTTQNPGAQSQAYKMLLQANNIQMDESMLDQPQQQPMGNPEQAGRAAEQFMKEQQGSLNV